MKAEVRETGPLQRELEIEVPAADVRAFIDEMVAAFRRRYTFPGFRPGKVPAEVVMGRFQAEIERAVLSELVPRTIDEALSARHIHPAGSARISSVRYHPHQPLSFKVELEVWPEIELQPYEGLPIEQEVEEVAESEVERYLEWLRERVAEVAAVDRPARSGDVLEAEITTIDHRGQPLKGTRTEEVRMEVGGASLLPEFRAASDGIRTGEAREFQVHYPEAYGNPDLKGQTRRYRLVARKIGEKKLPALDDDFARKVDPALDLEGLRAKARLRLESEKRLASRERLEEAVVDRLIRENRVPLPEGAVRAALERVAERHRQEGHEHPPEEIERYRPLIERAHRRELILAKVAEREGVVVGPAEVEAEIERIAQEEKRPADEVKRDLGDLDRFRDFLFERRVFEALIPKLKIMEKMVPPAAPDAGKG